MSAISICVFRDAAIVQTLLVNAPATLGIGRRSDAGLQLDDDLVSRQHARLVLEEDRFVLEDVSANGTRIYPSDVLKGGHMDLAYGARLAVGPFDVLVARSVTPTVEGHLLIEEPAPPAVIAPSPPLVKVNHALPLPFCSPKPITPADGTARRKMYIALAPLRRRIHLALLRNLDMTTIDPTKVDDPVLRPRVVTALRRLVVEHAAELPAAIVVEDLIGELVDEALGLGPLEPLLEDPEVTEIMVIDPITIFVEREGRLFLSDACFTDEERVRCAIERIITPLGRRIDDSQPLVDARLKDGSRVNAIVKPLALRGSCITIRKFPKKRLQLSDLVTKGSLTVQMGRFLSRSVAAKKNVLISGGTGSGKTTLLNILSAAIGDEERIVTIEDAAELQLNQPHVVSLETKPPNMEGKGAFTIRELVKNALRMRPDRIVVGECRGGEALDMLQAMNTGHDGSLTTVHANGPSEALARLETLSLMAGLDLPARAIREQIARSIHLIVQQSRLMDGSRKVTAITELIGIGDDGQVELRPLFVFEKTGVGPLGEVIGEFEATGYLPSYLEELIVRGLIKEGEPCF